MNQYSSAFEFNNYFLCFLAYHHTSMRFNTFMLESEYERSQHGWLSTEQKEDTKNFTKQVGQSIWDYIDYHIERSTIFHNFRYHPSLCKVRYVIFDFYSIWRETIYGLALNRDSWMSS